MIGIRYRTILVGYKVNCEKINLFYADSFWKFFNLNDRNFAVIIVMARCWFIWCFIYSNHSWIYAETML